MLKTSFTLIVMTSICVRSFRIQMTDEELKSVFPMEERKVPEYEIVSIKHSAHEREFLGASVKFEAFGKSMEFYLNHRDDILISTETRLYTAEWNKNSKDNVHYTMVNNFPNNYYVYQDAQQHAAFIIHEDEEGQFLFDGTLGSDMVLSSIPGHVQKSILYRRNNTNANDIGDSYPHVVYKKSKSDVHEVADLSFDIPTTGPVNNSRQKRDIPDSVHPQIISVIDYNLYYSIGGNVDSAWKYILSFWNGVDLRYRTISSPSIRLNIAAVVIAKDPWALQYLANHHVHPSALYVNDALDTVASYFYNEERFLPESYDVVITLTQSKLCTRKVFPNCYPILGAAFTGGACGRNYFHGKFYGTAIVQDDGGYNGILTAAHELGHLLGAKHDGQSLDTIRCSSYEGYLMSPSISLHENGWRWSSCTIAAFNRFLTNEDARCLRNVPPPHTQFPRILPGKLLSLDEQCQRNFGTASCPGVASSCSQLRCITPGNPYLCITTSPPAEGSPCGNGLICLNGRCGGTENSNPWSQH